MTSTIPVESEPAPPGTPATPLDLHVVYTARSNRPDPRKEIPELGFPEYWYPLTSARKVPKRKPLAWKILGRDLVLYRGDGDEIVVADDICPHRGIKMSPGLCHYAGTISCPYHAWTFDGKGELVAVLSEGPDSAMPGKARLRTYPSVVLHGIVFAWMGAGEPTSPREDLPPELFDGSTVFHDAVRWPTNWRAALENFQDNHAPYVHRNSVQLLMVPIPKRSYKGARAVIRGGGTHLSSYSDGSEADRPERDFFPAIRGYWPMHTYRKAWTWAFRYPPFRWFSPASAVRALRFGDDRRYHDDPEWNNGPHMPGIQRFPIGSRYMYSRWCVPIDENTTREFYLHAFRPASRRQRVIESIRFPFVFRWLYYRNLSFQDGKLFEHMRYDLPERFSQFDVETIGWRRLAILSARHGGRHDKIPEDVMRRVNAMAGAE
jgi:phenylpropionate dioxygenase-like ring-hydroxylating dioxygenase large terminal subunit